jgi:hypothetical protein
MDAHKNLVVTTVATAPSPATSGGSLVVATGDGAKFPATPFNVTISPDPTGLTPLQIANNSEIVRVTARSTDTLTITRAQESTAARTVVVGDVLAVTITAKTITDIEASLSTALAQSYVGYNAAGGTTDAVGSGAWKQVFKRFTLSQPALVSSVDAYVKGNAANVATLFASVWDDNAGVPGKIVALGPAGERLAASTNDQLFNAAFTATARWVAVPVGVYLPAGTYWLAINGGSFLTLHYDSGGSDYTASEVATWFNETSTKTNSSRNYSLRGTVFTAPSLSPALGSVKLFDQTLTADAASIDTGANGIPANCDLLEVFFTGRTDEALLLSVVDVRFNNDSGANYDTAGFSSATGSTTVSEFFNVAGTSFQPVFPGASAGANVAGLLRMVIHAYADPTFFKTVEWSNHAVDTSVGNTHRNTEIAETNYRSSPPINQITITPDTAGKKFKAGSRLTIYGRPSASSPLIVSADGWIDDSLVTSLTYSSADGHTFVATTGSNLTGTIPVGARIKLTQTTVKYFIVTAIDATTITLYGGTDYTLANAAISTVAHSLVKVPVGFPASPDKWTEKVTDNSTPSNATATLGTTYNLGSISIPVPIGAWNVDFQAVLQSAANTSSTYVVGVVSLSTANNSVSDAELSTSGFYFDGAGVTDRRMYLPAVRTKQLVLAAKTSYYLVESASASAGTTATITLQGTTVVRAVCAYL